MSYLTYEEYSNLGGAYDEATFGGNIDRACTMIDIRTQSRLQSPALFNDYDGEMKIVKLVCADLVDYISANKVERMNVTSRTETAGSVSESESYAVKTAEEYATDVDNILGLLGVITTKNGIKVDYRGAMS